MKLFLKADFIATTDDGLWISDGRIARRIDSLPWPLPAEPEAQRAILKLGKSVDMRTGRPCGAMFDMVPVNTYYNTGYRFDCSGIEYCVFHNIDHGTAYLMAEYTKAETIMMCDDNHMVFCNEGVTFWLMRHSGKLEHDYKVTLCTQEAI